MWICIDDCMIQFSEITKEWSFDSISLQDLLMGIVVMWFWLGTQNILQFSWGMDQWLLKQNYDESLAMSC